MVSDEEATGGLRVVFRVNRNTR